MVVNECGTSYDFLQCQCRVGGTRFGLTGPRGKAREKGGGWVFEGFSENKDEVILPCLVCLMTREVPAQVDVARR